jgi:rfaE bifunctional protein nucleotidyltransferase chain/domain
MLSILKNKLLSLSDLVTVVQNRKAEGEKLVFTNGCFDLIHVGHLRYLEKARQTGDLLVIGLNSDMSVRNLKGEGRPFVTEMERAEVLSALVFVDYIVIFSDVRPYKLIENLKPDFHVKGGDYKREDLPELPLVEKYGGKVVILEHIPGKSTTFMAEEICRKFK